MPLFGKKDKWQEQRNDLIKRTNGGKQFLPASPDLFYQLVVYVSPDAKALYVPYIDYLGGGNWRFKEKPQIPEDVVGACALRLLNASVEQRDAHPRGWRFDIDALVFSDMALTALPLLDTLVTHFLGGQYYELVYKNYLGTFLAVIAENARIHDSLKVEKVVPGGGWGAATRGYYAQGLAAFHNNDIQQATTAWALGGISGSNAKDEPAYTLCKEGLAKLK